MSSVTLNKGSSITGLFGKLPSHGDFIQRNLPYEFIERIDPWLQQYMSISQQSLGNTWLDIYLTSPIWRFVFSVGAINNSSWAGIMMPSVDRVGRYFPLIIAINLPWNQNPIEFHRKNTEWFTQLEELTLKALEGIITTDYLIDQIESLSKYYSSNYEPKYDFEQKNNYLFVDHEAGPELALPFLLDSILINQLSNYSLWSTSGSDLIDNSYFISENLPAANKLCSMIDGSWSEKEWYTAWVKTT